MKDTFSVIFFIRKTRADKYGMAPIFLRITVNSQRSEISVRRKVNPANWNASAGKIKGCTRLVNEINEYLDEIRHKIYRIHSKMVAKGKPLDVGTIRDKFLGTDKKEKSLLALYQDHNLQIHQLVGKEYSLGRYYQHNRTKNHLTSFILSEYHKEDIALRKVDLEFINRFEHYLLTNNKGGRNTITKYLTNFKKIMRIAFANNWIKKDPFYHWKAVWKSVEREALNEHELRQLIDSKLNGDRLNQVKDIFIFCCFTGLSYSDVKKLSSNHIAFGMNGQKWIKTKRTKTKTKSSIPLLPMAENILKKYASIEKVADTSLLLPVISNQKMNDYLKEIAGILKINKNLTFHLARHTFATTVTLANGVPIESVSRMLGHRSLRTTQIYAKVIDRKLQEDMEVLKGKFKFR